MFKAVRTQTYGIIAGALHTRLRVDRCSMDHTCHCDIHGEKKLESGWLHLEENRSFVRVVRISSTLGRTLEVRCKIKENLNML